MGLVVEQRKHAVTLIKELIQGEKYLTVRELD
jgi:hypothetical protein